MNTYITDFEIAEVSRLPRCDNSLELQLQVFALWFLDVEESEINEVHCK